MLKMDRLNQGTNIFKMVLMAIVAGVSSNSSFANISQNEHNELRKELMALQKEVQNLKNENSLQLHSAPSMSMIEKKRSTEVNIYGFIRADATYQATGASTMYNNINAVPLKNTHEEYKQRDRFRATAAATRIGANFRTETPVGEIKGKIETDFFGGATRDQFRIRHAYLTFDKWLVGQTWSNFIAPEYLPETIEPASYVGGSLLRVPVLRYTDKITDQTSFVLSIEDPKYTAATDPDNEMRLPAFVGRINHNFDNGSLISGRSFLAEKKTANDEKFAWGIGLGGKYLISPHTILKADYYHVKGDGRFLAWSNSGYALDINNQMHENEFDTISLGITHKFNPKLRSTIGYGYMKANESSTFAHLKYDDNTQNKQLWQGWANAIYSPFKSIDFGLEYVYGQRETFNDQTGVDNRFNMMISYDF